MSPFEQFLNILKWDSTKVLEDKIRYIECPKIFEILDAILKKRSEKKKTVMQFNTDGTQSNIFNLRNKTDSIFQKIPGGNLRISWDATFGVNITIHRERSEPRVEVVT